MKQTRACCRDVVKHVCQDLDENLSSPACRALRKHLAECPNCTAYLDSLKKTVRLYRSYPAPTLARDQRQKLIAILRLRAQKPRKSA